MKRILIGVCSTRSDKRFWDSFFRFTKDICEFYDVGTTIIRDMHLPDAQNEIVEIFMNCNYDYLLFMDDDHWGHTREMLDCLVEADSPLATIKSYSRHYPYSCALMRQNRNSYAGIENGEGYQEVDLSGFPMTLIKREVFEKMERPYFVGKDEGLRTWATDENFSRRMKSLGLKMTGCFQYCLPHDDITQETVWKRREEEKMDGEKLALYWAFRKKQMQGV